MALNIFTGWKIFYTSVQCLYADCEILNFYRGLLIWRFISTMNPFYIQFNWTEIPDITCVVGTLIRQDMMYHFCVELWTLVSAVVMCVFNLLGRRMGPECVHVFAARRYRSSLCVCVFQSMCCLQLWFKWPSFRVVEVCVVCGQPMLSASCIVD